MSKILKNNIMVSILGGIAILFGLIFIGAPLNDALVISGSLTVVFLLTSFFSV